MPAIKVADPKYDDLEYVTLVSDKGEFISLPKEVALMSGTLNDMLASDMTEARSGVAHFPEERGPILEKVCEYLVYKWKWADGAENVPDFHVRIPPAIALDVYVDETYPRLAASDYFDC